MTDGLWANDVVYRQQVDTWKRRLHRYQQDFDPKAIGSYDVVVILTGANDLKAMLFPFLLQEDDKELLRETKSSEKSGLMDDLQRLIQYLTCRAQESLRELNSKMERQMQASIESIRESADAITELLQWTDSNNENDYDDDLSDFRLSIGNLTASVTDLLEERAWLSLSRPRFWRAWESAANGSVAHRSLDNNNNATTLFVLPGMPARALPTFQSRPLRWFAIPVVDSMNRKKRQLAQRNGGSIMFVPDPTVSQLLE